MKKIAALFLALMCVIGLAGCSGERYTVELTVPAGSAEPFVFSEEEISPRKNTLKISAGAGVSSVEVLLSALGEGESKYFTLRQ